MTRTLSGRMQQAVDRIVRLTLLASLSLLPGLQLAGCGVDQEKLVIVTVTGLSPEIHGLRIVERLNGADTNFQELFTNLSQFALRLRAGTRGTYRVQVEGLNSLDCVAARGYAETNVGGEPRYMLSVALVPQNLDEGCEAMQKQCMEGMTKACANQAGSCIGGVQICTGGKWGPCSKVPRAQDTCDPGNDDNCNGIPNEGCKCINGIHPCPNQNGVCAGSIYVCIGGVPGSCSVTPDSGWHKYPGPNWSWDWNCDGVEERQYIVNGAWPSCRYTGNPRDLACCGPRCIPPPGAAAVVCGPSSDVCGNASECGDLILFRPAFCSSCGAPWPPDSYSDTQGCR